MGKTICCGNCGGSYDDELSKCPYCGSEHIFQKGYDSIGIQRFRCECGKYFKPTTGTIFDSRKIPVSEWIR